jgi:hypothetical protein
MPIFSGAAGATALGNFDKAECNAFANGRRDCVFVQSVRLQLGIGERQLAVVSASVARKLNFESIKHSPS